MDRGLPLDLHLDKAPALYVLEGTSSLELRPSGSWTSAYAAILERLYDDLAPRSQDRAKLTIDMAGVAQLDTLGAWIIEKISRHLLQPGDSVNLVGVSDRYTDLIAEVRQVNRRKRTKEKAVPVTVVRLEQVGRSAVGLTEDVAGFLQMLGAL